MQVNFSELVINISIITKPIISECKESNLTHLDSNVLTTYASNELNAVAIDTFCNSCKFERQSIYSRFTCFGLDCIKDSQIGVM